jgi:uncharacterized membrane protein YeiH
MMTDRHTVLASAALAVIAGVGSATANDRLRWEQLPDAAYLDVYDYYCAPVAVETASAKSQPDGNAALIYAEVLVGFHGGSCRDFYLNEVGSRADMPSEQGLVVVNR